MVATMEEISIVVTMEEVLTEQLKIIQVVINHHLLNLTRRMMEIK